jgi:hypothetical protein
VGNEALGNAWRRGLRVRSIMGFWAGRMPCIERISDCSVCKGSTLIFRAVEGQT